MSRTPTKAEQKRMRCAIYTRKSTEHGLEQAFNSLHAQRDACEAYATSQAHDGWECLPEHYDDGGFSGGNSDRPALARLLGDIKVGNIDCVIVHRVDRLSRSLLDFAKLMEVFEKHSVAFVSVTQRFDTSQSMGRLVLNILMSFGQFEKELIGERTRDKIAATRRKGKWSGGVPPLGYDVDSKTTRLVVNAAEAEQVKEVFALYLQLGSLSMLVTEVDRRGWKNKSWTTRKELRRGGHAFSKTSLHRLLENVIYCGRVKYKNETHPGEHEAIIADATFDKVQQCLRGHGRGRPFAANKSGSMLAGILRCASCDCAMVPSHTKRGSKRYRYYTCGNAQRRGWSVCPTKSLPAGEIEQMVGERLRGLGQDPGLLNITLSQAREQLKVERKGLNDERRDLERNLRRIETELRRHLDNTRNGFDRERLDRMTELQSEMATASQRLEEIDAAAPDSFDESALAQAFTEFGPVWTALTPTERTDLVRLVIETVEYDGAAGVMRVNFHTAGLRDWAEQMESKV